MVTRRSGWVFALRFFSLVALAIWVGGFTFYSIVVIPVLHDSLGKTETGFITQHVTDTLNAFGVAAVAVWWLLAACDRAPGSLRLHRARFWLLLCTSILLAAQIVLHRLMDRRLETVGLQGFYPWHRAYLLASSAQWFLNLGLLLTAVLARPADG